MIGLGGLTFRVREDGPNQADSMPDVHGSVQAPMAKQARMTTSEKQPRLCITVLCAERSLMIETQDLGALHCYQRRVMDFGAPPPASLASVLSYRLLRGRLELVPTKTTSTAAYVAVAARVFSLLARKPIDIAIEKSKTATEVVMRLFV